MDRILRKKSRETLVFKSLPKDGGGSRIRTYEVEDNRFTVYLWMFKNNNLRDTG